MPYQLLCDFSRHFFCLNISENKNGEVWFPAITSIMCSSRHIFDNWQKNE